MPAPDLDAYLGFYLPGGIPVFCFPSSGGKASVPRDLCHSLFAVFTNSALKLQQESVILHLQHIELLAVPYLEWLSVLLNPREGEYQGRATFSLFLGEQWSKPRDSELGAFLPSLW